MNALSEPAKMSSNAVGRLIRLGLCALALAATILAWAGVSIADVFAMLRR